MEPLAWTAKIGLVVVSSSTVSEGRYPRVAPRDVGFFTSRMLLRGRGLAGHGSHGDHAARAMEELASVPVDAIAYCCTVSGALRGVAGDRSSARTWANAGAFRLPPLCWRRPKRCIIWACGGWWSPAPIRTATTRPSGFTWLRRVLRPSLCMAWAWRRGRHLPRHARPRFAVFAGGLGRGGGGAVHQLHELRCHASGAGIGRAPGQAGGHVACGDLVARAGLGWDRHPYCWVWASPGPRAAVPGGHSGLSLWSGPPASRLLRPRARGDTTSPARPGGAWPPWPS